MVEHLWTDGQNPVDKYVYDHDEAGNRKYRENTTTTAKDAASTGDAVPKDAAPAKDATSAKEAAPAKEAAKPEPAPSADQPAEEADSED